MDIPVEVTVTRVTIYPDRARVTCQGRCELVDGTHKLIVSELPLAMDTESIRATGQGTAQVRLRSVDVTHRHYVDTPSAAIQELEGRLEALQTQDKELEDRQSINQATIDHLNGMRSATSEFAKALARGRSTAENHATLLRFFEQEDNQLRADLRQIEYTKREVQHEMNKLQRELDELQAARPRQRYEVSIEVDVVNAGYFDVEVSYVVGHAGWLPLYDIIFTEDETADHAPQLELNSLAEVFQNTGQSWTEVDLTISTARPALNQRVPDLKPWFIDVPRPQPRMAKGMAMRPMLEASMADGVEFESAPVMNAMADFGVSSAEVVVAQTQENGATISFHIPGKVDVPGDGSPHKTTISRHPFKPELDYLTIPRHTAAVYRRATITNQTDAPLLAGPCNLFVGDEFIGRNQLPYAPPSAEIELILGIEERIAAKRELVRRDVDKRLLRDVRQVVFAYEIEIENLLKTRATVTVKDQYPVSRHDQIKVRLVNTSHQPEEQSELNILEWKLQFDPGQKETIRFEYQIEHPRDLLVSGLID